MTGLLGTEPGLLALLAGLATLAALLASLPRALLRPPAARARIAALGADLATVATLAAPAILLGLALDLGGGLGLVAAQLVTLVSAAQALCRAAGWSRPADGLRPIALLFALGLYAAPLHALRSWAAA